MIMYAIFCSDYTVVIHIRNHSFHLLVLGEIDVLKSGHSSGGRQHGWFHRFWFVQNHNSFWTNKDCWTTQILLSQLSSWSHCYECFCRSLCSQEQVLYWKGYSWSWGISLYLWWNAIEWETSSHVSYLHCGWYHSFIEGRGKSGTRRIQRSGSQGPSGHLYGSLYSSIHFFIFFISRTHSMKLLPYSLILMSVRRAIFSLTLFIPFKYIFIPSLWWLRTLFRSLFSTLIWQEKWSWWPPSVVSTWTNWRLLHSKQVSFNLFLVWVPSAARNWWITSMTMTPSLLGMPLILSRYR